MAFAGRSERQVSMARTRPLICPIFFRLSANAALHHISDELPTIATPSFIVSVYYSIEHDNTNGQQLTGSDCHPSCVTAVGSAKIRRQESEFKLICRFPFFYSTSANTSSFDSDLQFVPSCGCF
jgi:hypothetical protein